MKWPKMGDALKDMIQAYGTLSSLADNLTETQTVLQWQELHMLYTKPLLREI